LILAIDTSSGSGSIALLRPGGSLLAERTVGSAGPHARWLLQSIASLLDDHGLAPEDIERYALAIGPGSFTGLRIGVSTIKGLAWSTGRPVTPVCTLRALALNAPYPGGLVCPLLDARKSEVYAAIYAFSGARLRAVMEPAALRPEALVDRMEAARQEAPQRDGGVLFLGSGLGVYGGFLEEACPGALLAPEPLWHIRAANIALLALEEGSPMKNPLEIAPLYLRKSEAELNQVARGAP
jgi:tRNA threonylcarbamoyladenosine biosynthesis protein TsaB